MLLLENKDVAQILDMESCLRGLEAAARAIALEQAIARPAATLVMPKTQAGNTPGAYQLQSREGVASGVKMAACRLISDNLIFESARDGSVRRRKIPAAKGNRYVGLILLFDTDTSELTAMFPDGEIQRRRVAGTGALVAKYVARKDASTLGLLGSGWQAEVAVPAYCQVRPISHVRVYSPNREHREAFCAKMRERVSCPLEPVANSAEVIQGSDIVVAVTDAIGPVIDGSLLQSGTHVTLSRYFELDPEGWRRCDLVIEGARPQDGDASYWSKQIWDNRYVIGGQDKVKGTSLAFRSTEFTATHARHIAFPDIILGKQSGRLRDEEISCFYISNPSGVQLAYLGAFIVEQARRMGLGRELPSEWFSEAEKD